MFSANEKKFIKELFDINSNISLKPSIVSIIRKSDIRADESNTNYPMGLFLIRFVKSTHRMMLYLDSKIRLSFVINSIEAILELLDLFYQNQYETKMPSTLIEKLKEIIFIAIALHYDEEKVRGVSENDYLTEAHYASDPLSELEKKLTLEKVLFRNTLNSHSYINPQEAKKAIDQQSVHHQQILEKYKATTLEVSSRRGYAISGILVLGCMIAFVLEQPVLVLPLFLMSAFIGYKTYNQPQERVMNKVTQQYYSRLLEYNLRRVNGTQLASSEDEMKIIKSSNTLFHRAKMGAFCAQQVLTCDLEFKVIEISPAKSKLQAASSPTLLSGNDDIAFMSSLFSGSSSGSTYNYTNLKKFYQKSKDDRNISPEDSVTTIEDVSSYRKITFRLQQEQQLHGCLVEKGKTLVYFDLDKFDQDFKADLPEIHRQFVNNEFSFGPKRGNFMSFKHLANLGYEFKFHDKKRIVFEETGKIILSSEENTTPKEVPHYKAIQYGEKR